MDYDYLDPTEITGIEQLKKFIKNNIEIGCKQDDEVPRETENGANSEDSEFYVCEDPEEMARKFCKPNDVLNISSNSDVSGEEESIPWCPNSRNVDEVLLQNYVSKFYLKDDFLDAPKPKLNTEKSQEEPENNCGDIQNSSRSSFKNVHPKVDPEQKEMARLSPQKQNFVISSISEDCLVMDSTPLLGNLATNLKDLLQKVDELLEAMDSRPHFNRLMAKSNSPWKSKIPQVDHLDSGISADKKPKILKEWTETSLKYSRLSTTLNAFLHSSMSRSQMMKLLADVRDKILECVDLKMEQESISLPENNLTASDANSDTRFIYNVERRLLTVEVTLTNIKFEVEKIFEKFEKENIPKN